MILITITPAKKKLRKQNMFYIFSYSNKRNTFQIQIHFHMTTFPIIFYNFNDKLKYHQKHVHIRFIFEIYYK